MDAVSTVFVLALCTWHAVEVWHHGEIFAGWRADIESWDADSGPVKLFFQRLLMCPFCLSLWVAVSLAVYWFVVGYLPSQHAWVARAPILGLAIARGANFFNDLFHDIQRTPK